MKVHNPMEPFSSKNTETGRTSCISPNISASPRQIDWNYLMPIIIQEGISIKYFEGIPVVKNNIVKSFHNSYWVVSKGRCSTKSPDLKTAIFNFTGLHSERHHTGDKITTRSLNSK